MRHLKALQTVTDFRLFPDDIHNFIDQLRALGVVTFRPIVASAGLSKYKVVRTKHLSQRSTSDGVLKMSSVNDLSGTDFTRIFRRHPSDNPLISNLPSFQAPNPPKWLLARTYCVLWRKKNQKLPSFRQILSKFAQESRTTRRLRKVDVEPLLLNVLGADVGPFQVKAVLVRDRLPESGSRLISALSNLYV